MPSQKITFKTKNRFSNGQPAPAIPVGAPSQGCLVRLQPSLLFPLLRRKVCVSPQSVTNECVWGGSCFECTQRHHTPSTCVSPTIDRFSHEPDFQSMIFQHFSYTFVFLGIALPDEGVNDSFRRVYDSLCWAIYK